MNKRYTLIHISSSTILYCLLIKLLECHIMTVLNKDIQRIVMNVSDQFMLLSIAVEFSRYIYTIFFNYYTYFQVVIVIVAAVRDGFCVILDSLFSHK